MRELPLMSRLVRLVVLVTIISTTAAPTLGAEPSSSSLPIIEVSRDVRSGDATGLAGGPLEVLLLVVVLGIVTALATAAIAKTLRPR
jgi:hypothetical protein